MVMQKKLRKQNWRGRLLTGVLLSVAALGAGCLHPARLDNTKRLVEENPKGFRDAVHSSPEGKLFIEETFDTIIDLEYELEKGGRK